MRKLTGIVLLLPLLAWAQSPFDGTWKMDLTTAQSMRKPETLTLKNGQYTCSTCIPKIVIKADGADHNVPNAKEYDTIAVQQVDDKTVQFTEKKGGKVVSQSTSKVSADGKMLTEEFMYFPLEGQPFTGNVTLTRITAGPTGAHAISGSWLTAKMENVSEQGLIFTLKTTADRLSSEAHGYSYEAKFDGKDYPVKGDRAGGTVSLKRVNDNTIEETYKQDGKRALVNEMTVYGNTMKVISKDVRRGTTVTFTANKQ